MKVFISVIVLLIIGIFGLTFYFSFAPGEYDEFAQCISNSGAKMYGSYECPTCEAQISAFGRSSRELPYVECGPLAGPINSVCTEQEITQFPTWIFGDGERIIGYQEFDAIAEKTNCSIPTN